MNLAGKVTIALAIIAALSAGSIAFSAVNYMRGMNAISDVRLNLSNLKLIEEGESEIHIAFHMKNTSPINVRLETFHFSLYLNGQFVGSNYEPFTEIVLAGLEDITMDFIIPIQPFYQQFISQAHQTDGFSWSARGRAKLLLPFRDRVIWMNINEPWSGYE